MKCIVCPKQIPQARIEATGGRAKTCSPRCSKEHAANLRRATVRRHRQALKDGEPIPPPGHAVRAKMTAPEMLAWMLTPPQVRQVGECLEWQGNLHMGYGRITYRGKTYRAHRLVWMLRSGDPDKAMVLHLCDNPPCVNPDHLMLGNQALNMHNRSLKHHREKQNDIDLQGQAR